MGYEIELSYDLGITSSVRDIIIKKAYRCSCEFHYIQYELEGRRRQIYKKRAIITFIFSKDGLPMQSFIRYIKNIKAVYIECISTDTGSFEIIYASPKYLSIMNKDQAQKYKEKKKN